MQHGIQERLNMTNLPTIACVVGLALLSLTVRADTAAPTAYQTCVACHGDAGQGNAALNAPALAGQGSEYLQRQLQHFKSGVRGADPRDTLGAQMTPMAATLSDADIQLIAAFLTDLPAPAVTPVAGRDLKNGNNYYQSKCGACHGGQAEGNPGLNSPALAMLDAAYLKRQVHNFQQGVRGAHADDKYGRQMRMMSTSLPSDKDLDDVIAFIQLQGVSQ
jgi:cytochrome c oxidase subunit 2